MMGRSTNGQRALGNWRESGHCPNSCPPAKTTAFIKSLSLPKGETPDPLALSGGLLDTADCEGLGYGCPYHTRSQRPFNSTANSLHFRGRGLSPDCSNLQT